jgi:hypothetical protein
MHLKEMGITLLFGAGLLFAAGTASAQRNGVVEGEFLIEDDRNSLITAFVSSVGDSNFVDVEAICESGGDSVTITADTNHPDDVRINQNKADVRQRNRFNENTVFISAEGSQEFSGAVFNCRSTKVEASVNTRRDPNNGNFRADVRQCSTNLSGAQVGFVGATCAATREINGSFNESTGEVNRLRINGRGTAFPQVLNGATSE